MPAVSIHPVFSASAAGTPEATRNGSVMTRPISMVHATVDHEPITLTAREDISELAAKSTAVESPKTMLITG